MIYQAIRISSNGKATYGDKYFRYVSSRELKNNDIVTAPNGDRLLILFKEED